MSLRKEQSLFALDIVELLSWATARGYEYTFGEAQRPIEMQRIYVEQKKSLTMKSKHLDKLAFDLFFFKDGKLLATKAEMQEIGNEWEAMSAKNSWGGNWNSFKDIPHFERRI